MPASHSPLHSHLLCLVQVVQRLTAPHYYGALCLLVDEAGFLVESKTAALIAELPANEAKLVVAESIVRALGVTDGPGFDALMDALTADGSGSTNNTGGERHKSAQSAADAAAGVAYLRLAGTAGESFYTQLLGGWKLIHKLRLQLVNVVLLGVQCATAERIVMCCIVLTALLLRCCDCCLWFVRSANAGAPQRCSVAAEAVC
jgi:hypothetical protein